MVNQTVLTHHYISEYSLGAGEVGVVTEVIWGKFQQI